jgi:hypothetical protein
MCRKCSEGGTVKKRAIVIVLVLAVLLLLVMAGTAYAVPAPPTPGITAGIVLFQQQKNLDGSVAQEWFSWVAIVGINGKPNGGSMTETDLVIGPSGKIISKVTDTEPVSEVARLNRTTMEFFDTHGTWIKVVDGGPGGKNDAWYTSAFSDTGFSPLTLLAGDIIVH